MSTYGYLFRYFLTCIFPSAATPEQIRQAKVIGRYYSWVGASIIGIGLVSLTWGLQGSLLAGAPPEDVIMIDEFEADDLQGKLNEVYLSGSLHLDMISFIKFSNQPLFQWTYSVIPLTDRDWKPGDPISVFVHSESIGQNMDSDGWDRAMQNEGLPVGSNGTLHIQKLMAAKNPIDLSGSIADAFRLNGLNVTDDVVMLEIIEGKRKKLLKEMYQGYIHLFNIVATMGLLAFLIGQLSRFRLRNYS